MESTTFFSTVPQKEIIMRNTIRLGPLHTCASAVLTTAQKAYKTAEALPGPVGSLSQKLSNFVGPIFLTLQYHWLAIFSFMDNQILTIENVIETIIPPSSYVFDKIDDLVRVSETLPAIYNNELGLGPFVRYLNWALAQSFLVLKFLITILTDWGINGDKEKEITEFHSTITSESSVEGRDNDEDDEEHVKETYKDILIKKKDFSSEEEFKNGKKFDTKMTYKTILQMGMKKYTAKKDNEIAFETMKEEQKNEKYIGTKEAKTEKKRQKSIVGKDIGMTCRRHEEETYFNPTCVKDSRFAAKKKARRKKCL